MMPSVVVPYIGTWIETGGTSSPESTEKVVPYIGTWIETTPTSLMYANWQSYLI